MTHQPENNFSFAPVKQTGNTISKIKHNYLRAITVLFACFLLNSELMYAQITVSGAHSASNGFYTTVRNAFNAINAQSQTGNNIVIAVTASTTETLAGVLNAGTWTSLVLYPTVTGLSISGSLATPLIDLNGAANVTIDGRVNAAGITKSFTIENTNTGTLATTIRLYNGANSNTVQYTVLKGGSSSASLGIITLGATGNNNNNNIHDNNITNSAGNRPVNAIYANTSGTNAGNMIQNNEIFDIFSATIAGNAIVLAANTTGTQIISNHFYQTITLNVTANINYSIIALNGTSVTGTTIQDNYIGGTQANALGSAMTFTSAAAPQFDVIYIAGGSSVAPTSIQGNTITNISLQSSKSNNAVGYEPGFFNAITVTGTSVYSNIGTVTGNIVGSQTTTNAIQLFPTNQTSFCPGTMIHLNTTGNVTVQNNRMGGITMGGTNVPKGFRGINIVSASGNNIISNNIIGSPSLANSIDLLQNTGSSALYEAFYGIVTWQAATVTISNNILANITQRATGTGAAPKQLFPILIVGSGATTIDNNTINNITSYSNSAATDINAIIVGIDVYVTSATINSISGNKIYNLQCANTGSFDSEVTGIFFQRASATPVPVKNNFIHSFQVNSASNTAKMYGINIGNAGGLAEFSNNIISLGTGISTGYIIRGINDQSGAAANAHKYYFNTIHVGGSISSGSNTAALFLSNASASGRNIRNNIFYNARSNSAGTAKHYGLYITGTPTLTANYNDYYATGTGGFAGFYSTDKATLPVVTSQDANSVLTNPGLASAGAISATGYLPSATLPGISISGFGTDYSGATRPATPGMGSLETTSTLPVTWVNFNVRKQSDKIQITWQTANEQYTKDFSVQYCTNNIGWKTIAVLPALGHAGSYSFLQTDPANGVNYFRILQTDIDGKNSYSSTRMLLITNRDETIEVIGNPVKNNRLTLQVSETQQVSLFSVLGKLVWQKRLTAGIQQVDVSQLPADMYILKSNTTSAKIFIVH